MHGNLLRFTIVLSLLGGGSLPAQDNPTFAGTWVSSEHPSQTLTITQDHSRLTQTDPKEGTIIYQLDGSGSRNETKTLSGEKWIHFSKTKWIGNAIVVTTTTTRETGGSWDWMRIYSLDYTGTLKVTTVDGVLSDGPFMAVNTVTFTQQK